MMWISSIPFPIFKELSTRFLTKDKTKLIPNACLWVAPFWVSTPATNDSINQQGGRHDISLFFTERIWQKELLIRDWKVKKAKRNVGVS